MIWLYSIIFWLIFLYLSYILIKNVTYIAARKNNGFKKFSVITLYCLFWLVGNVVLFYVAFVVAYCENCQYESPLSFRNLLPALLSYSTSVLLIGISYWHKNRLDD